MSYSSRRNKIFYRLLLVFFIIRYFIEIQLINGKTIDDKIVSIIYDEKETIVITKKDLERPNVFGGVPTLESLKLDALIRLDARKLKVEIPEDAIDRMIEHIQKDNNLTLNQFMELLKAEGHTLDSYREELKNMQLKNSILGFRVYSRAVVPYQDIVEYYTKHPIMQESAYKLTICFIPFESGVPTHVQKQNIRKHLETQNSLTWTDAFWIKDSEIDPKKDFIKKMTPKASIIGEESDGFRVYKLIEKREPTPVPLQERYDDIVKILKEPLEKELSEKYHKELLDNAIIVDF